MLEEIVLEKQNILDTLSQIESICNRSGIRINTQSVMNELEIQLRPLKFFELKTKVNNQTVFFITSETSPYEILAELNPMGFIIYYINDNKGKVDQLTSFLQLTNPLIHPLAKQMTNILKNKYQIVIDYDGDVYKSYDQRVAPIIHNTESPIIKANDVIYQEEIQPINYDDETPIDPVEEQKLLAQLRGGTATPASNPKFAGLPRDAFDQDYTK